MARFQRGVSGNPGGRPKSLAKLVELAQGETEANIRALVSIRDNKRAAASARVAAVKELLDRAYGKSRQAIEHAATEGKSFDEIVCEVARQSEEKRAKGIYPFGPNPDPTNPFSSRPESAV